MGNQSTNRKTAVLIHGISEERAVWGRQQPFLARSMDVVAYDVRGFGASPVGAGNGTAGQYADDLAQVLSALDCETVWLIGFSMGGVIAQRFALDFPERVEGAILLASSCAVGRPGREYFEKRIEEVSAGGLDALAHLNAGDARGCLATEDEDLIAEYVDLRVGAVRDAAGYLNAARAMLRLGDEPLTPELGAIACPTLVVAGELDPYCPPKASEMIASAIPGAKLEVLKDAGHCFHWEAADATNELLYDFNETRSRGGDQT